MQKFAGSLEGIMNLTQFKGPKISTIIFSKLGFLKFFFNNHALS